MSSYSSMYDVSFNMAMKQLDKNNQCLQSVNQKLLSNPQYYSLDSCNNLILTQEGNSIYQQLIQTDCSNSDLTNASNTSNIIRQYRQMVERRQQMDQTLNTAVNKESPVSYHKVMFQESNQQMGVGVVLTVLAISMIYYAVRHIAD